jgi:hypothetical protein
MALNHKVLQVKIEAIKAQIDELEGTFFTKENEEDFRFELDSACVSLDDAVEVLQRDSAYKDLQKQIASPQPAI